MSWSIRINGLDTLDELPEDSLLEASKDNEAYRDDAIAAFDAAKRAGLVSATISGGRTPSPYGGPDTVVLSVIGFDSHAQGHAVPPHSEAMSDMERIMLSNILYGPDE